jgi:hypothetical protein
MGSDKIQSLASVCIYKTRREGVQNEEDRKLDDGMSTLGITS